MSRPATRDTRGAGTLARRLGGVLVLALALYGVRFALVSRGPGAWPARAAAPQPDPRWGSAVAVVDDRLYLFGGWSEKDLHASPYADVYDPRTDRWTRLHELPRRFTHVTPVRDGDTLWFVGGFVGDKVEAVTTREVWRYDLATDTWTPGPPLPEARAGGGAVRLGRELHYYGGFGPDGHTASGRHWSLDLDHPERWLERATMPGPRGHLSGIAVDGLAYAIGGEDRHDHIDVAEVDAYDPAHERWKRLADLPTPRSHVEPATFALGRRIVIAGGRDNVTWSWLRELRKGRLSALGWDLPLKLWRLPNGELRGGWAMSGMAVYDIDRDRWTRLQRLPEPLLATTAKAVGNELIVTGGSRLGWSDPRPETWRGPLPKVEGGR